MTTPGDTTRPKAKPRGMAFGPDHQPRGKPWSAVEIQRLGTGPDSVIADELGRSRSSVILKRRELSIPAHQPPGRPLGSSAKTDATSSEQRSCAKP